MPTLIWVLVAWFVWYSSATVWQADIRLGYFYTQAECEAVGTQLDPRGRYRWDGMEGGPAFLRSWACRREAAEADPDLPRPGLGPAGPDVPVLAGAPAPD